MALSDRIFVDRETAMAIAFLWVIAFICTLVLGQSLIPAIATSTLAVFALSMSYLVENIRKVVATPAAALGFLAVGMVVTSVSFGGDCYFGSLHSPNAPLLEACIHHSGIGIGFTVMFLVASIGIPVMALLRMLVARVWKRG